MLIEDLKQNDSYFSKNLFGLTIISNKNPLTNFVIFLNEPANQLPLANLNFNLRFLPIKNSNLNTKFNAIFCYGMIGSSLACRFFSKNLDKIFFEKINSKYSLQLIENNGLVINEENFKNPKKSQSFWSKIFNYLSILMICEIKNHIQ